MQCDSLGYVAVTKFHQRSYRSWCRVEFAHRVLINDLPVPAGVWIERRAFKLSFHTSTSRTHQRATRSVVKEHTEMTTLHQHPVHRTLLPVRGYVHDTTSHTKQHLRSLATANNTESTHCFALCRYRYKIKLENRTELNRLISKTCTSLKNSDQ